MIAKPNTTWLAAILITSALTSSSMGTGPVGYFESDMQYFAPVDLDFECRPLRKDCGYFFRYDKLSWNFGGSRVTVGDPNKVVLSEQIYNDGPFNEGDEPPRYEIINGLQDVPPDSAFAWGERYEFGKFNKNNGWMVGILDGPEAVSQKTYGFDSVFLPNTLPLITRGEDTEIDQNFTVALTGFFGNGSADLATSRNGFGSVHVNFETAPGYTFGFRDYHFNGVGNQQGPTEGGPGRIWLPAEVIATFENGVLTEVVFDDGTILNGGPNNIAAELPIADGQVDDLDGDGLAGFFLEFIDTNGNGVFDDDEPIVGNGVDFGDLHEFNIAFAAFHVRNVTRTDGIELMHTFDLSNRHEMAKDQGVTKSLGFGVRYLRLRDTFYFDGRGSILGRTYAETKAQNSIVGPQVHGKWNRQKGRWNLGLDGRVLLGANIQDTDQVGGIGEDLAPGAVNRPVAAQPTFVSYSRRDDNFSPVIEFRAESSYQLTSAIALKLGYTAMFIDNITRSAHTVRWYLPDLGLLEGGEQDIFINGAHVGVEVVH